MRNILLGMLAVALLASCGGTATFSINRTDSVKVKEEKNKKTAMAYEMALIHKDLSASIKDNAPNYADYGNGENPPMSNVDSIKAYTQHQFDAFPNFKGENMQAFADSDVVFIIGTWSGTFAKDLEGIKATHRTYKVHDVDIFTFNNQGQITTHRAVQGSATFALQLGLPVAR